MTGTTWTRRHVLRGALGAMVALPALESLSAAPQTGAPPRRFLLCSGGFSLGPSRDDAADSVMAIAEDGAGYTMPVAMAPLAAARDRFSVVSGLRIPIASGGEAAPPGGRVAGTAPFHAHQNPLLAGIGQRLGCESCVTGPSPDQVAADAISSAQLFRSLSLRVQADGYTPATQPEYGVLSYRSTAGAGSKVVPVPALASPRLIWLTLTGAGVANAGRLYELEQRRSVLDLVDRRSAALTQRLGSRDRSRLERHFDELRAMELRIGQLGVGGPACAPPEDPGADPTGASYYYGNEAVRATLIHDLLRYALVCDLTRSVSLMYTYWKSEIGTSTFTDYDWTTHEVLHNGSRDQVTQLVSWHMGLWADLLDVLATTPEDGADGEGSLLDQCSVVYLPEGGFAPLGASERSHSTENMVVLVAGGAGGLSPGRHIRADGQHPLEAVVSAMQAAGVEVSGHGEVTGEVPALFG